MIIIAGQRYGALRAMEDGLARSAVWCICDCGKRLTVLGNNLRRGKSKSCGCVRDAATAARNRKAIKHGHAKNRTREYSSWSAMVSRCTSETNPKFREYGARGIEVCDRWLDFRNFLADMGTRPPNTSIDRVNGLLGYEPGNCRWATPKEQRANRVR